MALVKGRLRWVGHALWMTDCLKLCFNINLRPNKKQVVPERNRNTSLERILNKPNFMGGGESKALKNWGGGGACLAVLTSGGLVLKLYLQY